MTVQGAPDLGSLDETMHTLSTPVRRTFSPSDLH
jgi:hypothetical protein